MDDYGRIRQANNGTTTKNRWYFGGSQEREQAGSDVTDLVDEYSFDAWGRRRNKDNWTYNLSGEPDLFAGRGFTAHEHLEDFNLVNMNGRMYDPVVGRFLSPDPIVQAPDFTQGFNPYSYCLNNPLKYADPSGYTWWSNFWDWVGKGFDNLADWMTKNNVQFEFGVNMGGGGSVPFVNVSGPGGVNVSVGYNIENDMIGIGNNTSGFNSFYYPTYNYNAPIERTMNEWYAYSERDGWHAPIVLPDVQQAGFEGENI
jgi:RHS repeat-associated protein